MYLFNIAFADEVVGNAISQASNSSSSMSAGFINLLPMLLIFIIFYFLLIRPQMKKQKQLQEMISNLKRGDKVIVVGGIIATISKIDEKFATVLIDNQTSMQVLRSSVSEVVHSSNVIEKKNDISSNAEQKNIDEDKTDKKVKKDVKSKQKKSDSNKIKNT